MFPALSILFFVVPFGDLSGDATSATASTAQLSVFAAMSACLFTFGVGVAEDRALAWDPYVRTLPAGPGPRLAGRLLTGLLFALIGLVPLLAVAALFTSATVPPARFALAAAALALSAIPFLGIGLGIGYSLPAKAALAVARLVLFPMAFAGGLFPPPMLFPACLDRLSAALPSRAGRDLVVGAATGQDVGPTVVAVLAAWSVTAMAFAVGLPPGRGPSFPLTPGA